MVCFISFNRSVSSSWSSIQFWRKHIETRGMSQINMQKTYQLLIVVMLIGLSMARPNGNIESQVKNRLIAFHFTLISNMVIKWIKTIFSAFSIVEFHLEDGNIGQSVGALGYGEKFPILSANAESTILHLRWAKHIRQISTSVSVILPKCSCV